jgi:arylsulfatase A
VVEEAIGWLKEKRDSSKPFFLTVWTHEPHYPIKSDPAFKALYPGLSDGLEREHHANVTQMDHAFGKLMGALAEMGLAEETFVFFTSDNGPEGDGVKTPGRGSSGGFRGRKRDLHEGGIRVPGIARWPGKIPAGVTLEQPVIGSDLLPTMLAAACVHSERLNSRVLDGVNVLPMLTGKTEGVERPQPLFWRLQMAPNAKVAMREGDWKILANDQLSQFEFYNLARDPKETTDLQVKEADLFARMRARLLAHNAAVEEEGPDWWKRLSPSGGHPLPAKGEKDRRSKQGGE